MNISFSCGLKTIKIGIKIMCGLSGTFNFGNHFIELISDITDSIKHRGPDAQGLTSLNTDGSHWMAHNRLSILDLSDASNQPIISKSGRYVIAYNGEEYGFQDFGTYASDTLMWIDQIERFGFSSELLNKMIGMFAISVYDKEKQQVHLAVDQFGQKPIYYYHDGLKFAFASTPGALTHLKDKWELDREALDQLWVLGSIPFDKSLFKGIMKLPGSYMATFDLKTGELKLEKWWTLNPQRVPEIEELIIDSIEKVKVADVPVNIYLSGGIDSTLVASRFTGARAIHLESDEKKYAEQAALKHGIDLKICPLDYNRDEILSDYARKTGDCAMSATQPYIVSRAAKQFGKVAVIANGADELFYGYPRTHSLSQDRHMMREGCLSIHEDMYRLYKDEYDCDMNALERLIELRIYVQNDLNKTLDFASMANSVEVRSPFLDPRLINAALAIPYKEHYSARFQGKTILKTMLSKLGYSDSFLTREKQGFSLPAKFQKSNDQELKWCVDNGFIKIEDYTNKKDKYHARDIIYLSATAASFKAWYGVWKSKLS